MKILDMIGAQGELRIYKIDAIPEGLELKAVQKDSHGNHILSHSEKGHHHVLDRSVDVKLHVEKVDYNGGTLAMETLYAIVKEPTALHQTSTHNHKDIALDPGIYAIKVDVEFDPFSEQIRQVKD